MIIEVNDNIYPTGFTQQRLKQDHLKCPKNLDVEAGFYNGITITVLSMSNMFIQAKITNGSRVGNKFQVLIILTS